MKNIVLIPLNSLSKCKTRLSDVLTDEERKGFTLAMLNDVCNVFFDLGMETYIVTPEKNMDLEYKANIFYDTSDLNTALVNATKKIEADTSIIVPADIPLIKRFHVEKILKMGSDKEIVIVPSRAGGTSLLYRSPKDVIDPLFNGISFFRHLKLIKEKKLRYAIYDSFLLSIDVDTKQDFVEVLIHGEGTRSYEYLRNIGFKISFEKEGRPFITRSL
ncbi:MAG: 2-phospho-L-lactate guanylyltransferase [Candidatus Hydrothermarchaeota archaeon]